MVGFHNKPSLTPRPSSRPACCATCRHARLRLRGLSGPRDVRARPMRGWVFSASTAGRRCRKSPKAPRPATPAALRRPLPMSVSSASPAAGALAAHRHACGMGHVRSTDIELGPKARPGAGGCGWELLEPPSAPSHTKRAAGPAAVKPR